MVWTPGQSIGFIKSTWFVDDCEVKLGEEEGPSCLSSGEFLLCAKICKIIMICPNFENLGVSFKVVLPVLEGLDDGKEFFVVNVVV